MIKNAIYTVYLGGYDNEPRPYKFRNWHNVIIADRKINETGWHKVIYVEPTDRPDIESRRYKWLSHRYLQEYNLVCYHDANITIYREPPVTPFRIKHRKRSTVLEEVEACNKQVHRCTPETLNAQYQYLIDDGFKDDVGLFQNGFFCREHNNIENVVGEEVFKMILKFTPRDQVAFPYVAWKLNYTPPKVLDMMFYMRTVKSQPHKVLSPKIHSENTEYQPVVIKKPSVNVHHITPGRSDKNYGKAINDVIRSLPDQDWICLRDIDTIPMYHEAFYEQCEKIATDGRFDLVGCMTNRLGLTYQLYNGVKSNDPNIITHREIAKKLYEEHGAEVVHLNKTIGGLFMLFSKKTWAAAGGFPEGGIMIKNAFIDYHFCNAVLKKGLKIGLAKGIYLFHYYRLHHGDETRSKESKQHLLA